MSVIKFPTKGGDVDQGVTQAFAQAVDQVKKGNIDNCVIILRGSNGKHYKLIGNMDDNVYHIIGLMDSLKNEIFKNKFDPKKPSS